LSKKYFDKLRRSGIMKHITERFLKAVIQVYYDIFVGVIRNGVFYGVS